MTRTEYAIKVDWLSRAFKLEKKIKILTEKIEYMKSTAQGTCAKINPVVTGGDFASSKVENKVVTYVDLEKLREKCLEELETARGEISHAICDVDDITSFSLLMSRYLNYMSWDDINTMLCTSFGSKYVYRAHRRAINIFNLPKETA